MVLVRSGWGRLFDEGAAYVGRETGVPGVGRGRRPVARRAAARARSAPTRSPSSGSPRGGGHSLLPAHNVLLVEHGIYIVEAMDLERLSATGWAASSRSCSIPLNLYGATGSPVRPLAMRPA